MFDVERLHGKNTQGIGPIFFGDAAKFTEINKQKEPIIALTKTTLCTKTDE